MRRRQASRGHRAWYLLLLVPFVGLLWVPFYDSTEPELFGFPFFYWYQFAWVFIAVIITAVLYRATDPHAGGETPPPPGERAADRADHGPDRPEMADDPRTGGSEPSRGQE
jgi:hypothetical protein